jgi:hypothetical protein
MTRKKISAGRDSSGAQTFVTAGECFLDGTIIELVSGSSAQTNLLHSNGCKAEVRQVVEYDGRQYKAISTTSALTTFTVPQELRRPMYCSTR